MPAVAMPFDPPAKSTFPPLRRPPRYPAANRSSSAIPAAPALPSRGLAAPVQPTATAPRATPPRATPPRATPAAAAELTILQKIAFVTLALFLVISYGRLAEIFAIATRVPAPLAQVSIGLAFLGMLLCGVSGLRHLDSSIGRLMLLYTFWLMLTIPVSVWRGGGLVVFSPFLGPPAV